MRHLLLILSFFIAISVSAQNSKRNTIPIKQLQAAADNFAEKRWENIDAASPIPYYDPQDNIVAYGFNYAINKQFPDKNNLHSGNELTAMGHRR